MVFIFFVSIIFLFHLSSIIVVGTQQTQIENKIHTIQNVIDMLDGIINADKTESPKKEKNEPKSDDSSPERLKTKVIESLSRKRKDSDRSSTRPTEE